MFHHLRNLFILFSISGTIAFTILAAGDVKSADLFTAANQQYEKRNYAEAIRGYESMLTNNSVSSALLFNLGNACFKAGQRGLALHRYLLAARISPRDPDIQANIRFTRDRVQGNSSVQAGPLRRALTYFSLNEIAFAAAILFWGSLALLCWVRLQPGYRVALRSWIVATSAALAFCVLFLVAAHLEQKKRLAIVTVPEAIVRFGPLDESQTAFTVPDGTELRLINQRDSWLQVADRAGRTGWLHQRQAVVHPLLPQK